MTTRRLELLHCITPLHNGSGEGLGVIDRPVIRESTTNYPYIQGSTIKGALRAIAAQTHGKATVQEVFGPRADDPAGQGHGQGISQGCASFGDASLVLLPVQSLQGIFGWVTCPLILARLARWCDLSGNGGLHRLAMAAAGRAIPSGRVLLSGTDLCYNHREVCLGGMVFTAVDGSGPPDSDSLKLAEAFGTALFDAAPGFWWTWFAPRLAIVSDDDFALMVGSALPVEANIRIGPDGVTETGSLRYTEFLPAETVLAAFLAIDKPLRGGSPAGELDAAAFVDHCLKSGPILQFGADETKGKGLVRIRPAAYPTGGTGKGADDATPS
ncbi:MAG: type III-B CRISPR module RAMP protein Cmr4 [Candidatus Eisenbacteria bacterium]|nr:type III-B CRISPR module RAMP protein Cmr4 [Candidatus Eisenbacteria bacterium]